MHRLVFFVLCLSFYAVAFAAVPQTINYQGHLASSTGTPVNAAVDMTFTIYDAATNGTNLWTEDQTVQVNNGIYAVALGSVNPIAPAIIDGDLWLGVKVGTDAEMSPRQKLNSVPFAIKAQSIDQSYEESICKVYDWHHKVRPDFCDNRNYKVVFITSTTYTGNLGGVAGADQKCQDAATAANLPGSFKAWISDNSSQPADTFVKSTVPYVLLDGNYFADDWAGLASPHNPLTIDEFGNPAPTYYAWTATSTSGTRSLTDLCVNWTMSANNSGWVGTSATNSSWTIYGRYSCGSLFSLYCFEQ